MKVDIKEEYFPGFFLSDLCGREGIDSDLHIFIKFLSDLCGREGTRQPYRQPHHFLSDLCGREGFGSVAIS